MSWSFQYDWKGSKTKELAVGCINEIEKFLSMV